LLSQINLEFPKKDRKIAIENNKKYQKEITKFDFIKKLNNSQPQRIEYK